jgi:sugar phosphate isomerase/epimerase
MRWAICNEILEDRALAEAFRVFAEAGYAAVELAPFTLGPQPTALGEAEARRIRRIADDEGLAILGMHWLLARTEGLHIAEKGRRQATLDHLRSLTELCSMLGCSVMVFGSPDQRSTPAGMDPAEARARSLELFAEWAVTADAAGVTICLEALPRAETDFMTTTQEVIDIVEELDSPAVRLVLDVKSMADENQTMPELITLAAPYLAHFQANDANRGGPGFGDTDFVPILAALREVGYDGDISVEAFDYSPDRETVVTGSIRTLEHAARAAGMGD